MTAAMFITYDGLLDPLGPSQILPYLYSIAKSGRSIHIVSFEKPDRFAAGAAAMRAELDQQGIAWTPVSFTRDFGKLGKIWDLSRMYATALRLHFERKFDIIHCRGYQAMQVGCLLRRLTGAKSLFDMRGLWVDERVDGGLWRRDRWPDEIAYRVYKRIESRLLACATYVIVLTERVLPELQRLNPRMTAPVTVIPCCADFDHFTLPTADFRQSVRKGLGIPQDATVISYLGSLGTWYLLEDMLRFFAAAAERSDKAHMLFITRDWQSDQDQLLRSMGLERLRNRIHVQPATRVEVPALLGTSDVMLSFIKPAYSKIASSPTKLAEAFAMGIPVISNSGVGDVDELTDTLDAGAILRLDDPADLERVIRDLDRICQKGGAGLRERARTVLGLEVAAEIYRQVYGKLESAG